MKKRNFFALSGACALACAGALVFALTIHNGGSLFKIGVHADETWNHYAERMPGALPGIKEYWVSCNSNEHVFTAPTGTITDVNGWETSGFVENDDRYTYSLAKVAESALSDADLTKTAPSTTAAGYQRSSGRLFTASGNQGANLDISGYDFLSFGLYVDSTLNYGIMFGGNSGGDDVEVAIAAGKNITMWNSTWYYFSFERNADNKWDGYVGKFDAAKRFSSSIVMDAQFKTATNLNAFLGIWNWNIPEGGGMIYSTEVYAGEKEHHYVWDNSKISPVETGTCSVCGDVAERPAGAVNFTTNKYGAKLMNGSSDVSTWGGGYNGGNKLNVFGPTSIAYAYYGWGLLDAYLPRIDFTKYSEVSFKLGNVQVNDADPTGNPAGFRLGLSSDNTPAFASAWDNCEITNGKITFTTYANKVVANISSFGFLTNNDFVITDADVINGNKSVVLYVGSYLNDSTSYSILLTDLNLVEKPDAADITDASIKEVFLTKQVRRVEQQDAWKAPIGDASNEAGHADYYRIGGRDAIHFSAHYASDDPKFAYNSGFSEWRFAHQQAGITAVTFAYLYEDSNTDTFDDGAGNVHTMAQWYGAAYQGRTMTLIPDGKWHVITVTGDAYDINYFVMKIYHFTGDIYISNIVYASGKAAADVNDASIKEIFLEKQVRRVEQQDAWKAPIGDATNEAGHAEYYEVGGVEAIRFSAHYEREDQKFTYNNNWSEWRFSHAKEGLTSVTLSYLYVDINSELGNDGTSDVHTMAQWYGAAYQGRTMNLIPDGQWHNITVTGDAYNINFFVMKIYHFTGDIYLSNIVYA